MAKLRLSTRGMETAKAIRDRKVFTTSGALCAIEAGWSSTGRLPLGWATMFDKLQAEAFKLDLKLYIVYSYGTPIAWWSPVTELWYIPQVKYSVTTSKHQGNLYMVEAAKVTELS